ncbi:MAG: SpaH/EbpB family LPXTG-anchored major pilin [Oscillospiraceae bacterium]|nr:SpaH/EbpB family LPXTG-anchored major pilin [Oscillospiraceae bacterium]
MKNLKRMLAIMLTCIMALTLGVVTGINAFADDPATYKITITPQDEEDHSYDAYQIFAGDLSDNILSNIVWGSGVKEEGLTAALAASDAFGTTNPFASVKSAEDVADVLADANTNYTTAEKDALLDTFCQFLAEGGFLADTATASTGAAESDGTYVLSNLAAGYYLIDDTTNVAGTDSSKSRFMVEIVKNVEVTAKTDLPTLDKKINEGTGVSQNTASIGDDVPFILTSKVPDMTGYEKYFFIVNDTLCSGLTFNDDVIITIGGKAIEDYTVSESNGEIKIVFNDFIQYLDQKDAAIEITYSAKVNEGADTTDAGNPNTASLTYSNNPNVTPKGDNEPDDDDDDVIGETPDAKTITYVTNVQINKIDEAGKPLKGASFKLTGTAKFAHETTEGLYIPDAAGTYYLLKDGKFTTTAPTDATKAKYASTTTKYKFITDSDKIKEAKAIVLTATSDDDGIVSFPGLGEGEYTITETAAPNGYNKLKDDITLTITATLSDTDGCEWSASVTPTATVSVDNDTTLIEFDVENHQGTTLPTTGGIGTKLFYILGSLLVIGSAVVFVTKKRMAAAK